MADDQPICSHCGEPQLPECIAGNVFIKDPKTGESALNPITGVEVVKECRRIRIIQIRNYLGPEIASVKHAKDSPLLVLGKAEEPPKVDFRTKNAYITGSSWPKLLPHLKWALGRNRQLRFEIVTDQRIKTVFVGNEQYKARSKSTREDTLSYNSLEDLVGSDVQLLIIRLGCLGHRNVAAAGALKEALMIRETLTLPTWLVNDADRPWTTSPSHDPDVEYYVSNNFEVVDIEGVDPGEAYEETIDVGIDVDGEVAPAPDPQHQRRPKRRRPKRPPPPPPSDEGEDYSGGFEIELPGDGPKWRRS